jgi:hypothetical protein
MVDTKKLIYYDALLTETENQFKLSLAVNALCVSSETNAFDYLSEFSYGRHLATEEELRLDPDDEKVSASALEHCATYVMALQLDNVLKNVIEDRFKHADPDIKSAAWISRLIRNAFAHNPLHPEWQIYSECDKRVYAVKDIITLSTTGLNGKYVEKMHYGGPLALLRLSTYVKTEVLGSLRADV